MHYVHWTNMWGNVQETTKHFSVQKLTQSYVPVAQQQGGYLEEEK